MLLDVQQIIVGFVNAEGYGSKAEGSVTLIQEGSLKILVDVGSPDNWGQIVQGLAERGIDSSDINVVVITHGHIDHCANLGRFSHADVYMDNDLRASNGIYSSTEKTFQITSMISVLKFRGHTDNDLIVLVKTEDRGVIVISGDLFECEDDEKEWMANSRYLIDHEKSRTALLSMADWIVPGHGPIFRVRRKSETGVAIPPF